MLETNANTANNEMKTLSKDANSFINEARESVVEKSAEMRNRGAAMMDSTLSKAKEMQASALENSKKVIRNTDDYVQKNPWRAVTVSAGVGLLLGFLFRRK